MVGIVWGKGEGMHFGMEELAESPSPSKKKQKKKEKKSCSGSMSLLLSGVSADWAPLPWVPTPEPLPGQGGAVRVPPSPRPAEATLIVGIDASWWERSGIKTGLARSIAGRVCQPDLPNPSAPGTSNFQ